MMRSRYAADGELDNAALPLTLPAAQRNAPADGETLAVLRQLEEQRRKQRDEDARKEEEETMRVLSDKDREEVRKSSAVSPACGAT